MPPLPPGHVDLQPVLDAIEGLRGDVSALSGRIDSLEGKVDQ